MRLRPFLTALRRRARGGSAVDAEAAVAAAFLDALGRSPDPQGGADYAAQLRAGRSASEIVRELLASPEGVARAASRLSMELDDRTDDVFVRDLYLEVLGREADESGRAWLTGLLRAGARRQTVAFVLSTSEESLNRQWAARAHIQDLRELRPESYGTVTRDDGSEVEVYRVDGPADVDWMESAVLEHGYYEKPGIWSLALDDDKRRMGDLLSRFAPRRALEIGCSSGTVLAALAEQGVEADGLEISRMAIQRADPAIRRRIIRGDLLEVELEGGYDLVFGLDLFEHLNPNRLGAYLDRLAEVIADDGFLFVNSPAFGPDPVYGTVFDVDVESWREDAAAGRLFRHWLVDEEGYPAHGHLVWAAPSWWTDTFAAAGFHRQVEVERAAHRVYDRAFEAESLARKAFFVFSRSQESGRSGGVVERFAAQPDDAVTT